MHSSSVGSLQTARLRRRARLKLRERCADPANLAGRVRTWVWLAYADPSPLAMPLFDLPFDVFLLGLVDADDARVERLAALPDGKSLGAGVVDAVSPEVETADRIRERLARLLEVVPAERLRVAPDAELRALTEEQATAKLTAMVAAARSS